MVSIRLPFQMREECYIDPMHLYHITNQKTEKCQKADSRPCCRGEKSEFHRPVSAYFMSSKHRVPTALSSSRFESQAKAAFSSTLNHDVSTPDLG
ncbi:hypothetical protein CEXT_49181 [Caerostris extrusa]|uniref:Uncharacterized protein n=1 Tax=Caerostris extrusa TaxID=172846 RepID=A0AAV4XV18_CAEEX|nr:hypothetical protein CEXT_49181 [Caerostris extrusa]